MHKRNKRHGVWGRGSGMNGTTESSDRVVPGTDVGVGGSNLVWSKCGVGVAGWSLSGAVAPRPQ